MCVCEGCEGVMCVCEGCEGVMCVCGGDVCVRGV